MSESPISKNKLLTTLDWFLFFVLCAFAFWFCWPILVDFEKNETSYAQSNLDVEGRPTITICFETRCPSSGCPDALEEEKSVEADGLTFGDEGIGGCDPNNEDDPNDEPVNTTGVDYSSIKRFVNLKHFKICYGFCPFDPNLNKSKAIKARPKVLELGHNTIQIMLKNQTFLTEVVKLEQYGLIEKQQAPTSFDISLKWKGCYKISTVTPIIARQREIKVKMAKFVKFDNKTEKPSVVANFFVTSDKNANGILQQDWMEGEESSYMAQPGDTITVKMRPEQHNFLASRKSNCSEKWPYYECIGAQYAANFDKVILKYEEDDSCEKEVKKCSPFPFPNMENYNISLCNFEPINNTDYQCAALIWKEMYVKLQKDKVCQSKNQYTYVPTLYNIF